MFIYPAPRPLRAPLLPLLQRRRVQRRRSDCQGHPGHHPLEATQPRRHQPRPALTPLATRRDPCRGAPGHGQTLARRPSPQLPQPPATQRATQARAAGTSRRGRRGRVGAHPAREPPPPRGQASASPPHGRTAQRYLSQGQERTASASTKPRRISRSAAGSSSQGEWAECSSWTHRPYRASSATRRARVGSVS
jgi:hypothetical protein